MAAAGNDDGLQLCISDKGGIEVMSPYSVAFPISVRFRFWAFVINFFALPRRSRPADFRSRPVSSR